MSFIVAIDGPAGTGKGTITAKIAKKFNLVNIDSGALFRCVALETINKKVDINNEEKLKKLLEEIKINYLQEEENLKVILNEEDVTTEIRTDKVNKIVADVSCNLKVREFCADFQRKYAKDQNVIAEGRDIATNIFPNADVKIYLDASIVERVNRRLKQNKKSGIQSTYKEIYDHISKRDYTDKNKPVGALKKAENAIIIDSSQMSINQVNKKISKIIKKQQKRNKRKENAHKIRKDNFVKKVEKKFTKAMITLTFNIMFKMDIRGELPKEGGYIICANHVNYWDALSIVILNKRQVNFVGKEELYEARIFNWLGHLFDCIPIKRDTQDIEAMKRCFKVIKSGGLLGLFPEGTRNGMEKNGKAKNGAAFMALKTNAKVIPVGVSGKFTFRSKMCVNYGEPIDLSKYDKNDKEQVDLATKEIMDNIMRLTKIEE